MRRFRFWLRAWWGALLSGAFLLAALLFFWACTDFALPAPELALRRMEQEAILPTGITVAQDEVEMREDFDTPPRFTWFLRQYEDGYRLFRLEREQEAILPTGITVAQDEVEMREDFDTPPRFTWFLRQYEDGYRLFRLERRLGMWRPVDDFYTDLLCNKPSTLFLVNQSTYSNFEGWSEEGADWTWYHQMFLLAISPDPETARMEATVGWRGKDGEELVTAPMTETAPGSGIWILLADVSMLDGGGTLFYGCQSYDASGRLLSSESNMD